MTATTGQHPTLASAQAYVVERGWAIVPIPHRQKKAVLDGWPDLHLAEQDIPRYFSGNSNIGVLCGSPSNGLTDVDCDAPEAVAAAAELLPPTTLIHGRPDKPDSHYWYSVTDPLKTTKYQFTESGQDKPTMLVELRGNGCQTVVPPSIHPSGEQLTWTRDGEAPHIAPDALCRIVARVAVAALIARHWPGQGSRDDAALALCGMLLRAGWDADAVSQLVRVVARAAGDEEWPQRDKAERTARKLHDGEAVTGATSLAHLLDDGERVVRQVRDWLRLRDSDQGVGAQDTTHEAQKLQDGGDAPARRRGSSGSLGQAKVVRLCDVPPERVEWLDKGYVPLGKITGLIGNPGLGKSTLALDYIARYTTGRPMPGGSQRTPGNAVVMSAEDGLADTIAPRLILAGAALERVTALTAVEITGEDGQPYECPITIPSGLMHIRRAIEATHATLLVIDPLVAYLDSDVNSHRDQDVRRALAPLARMAEETKCAILLVRHLNKGAGGDTLYRGGGSIGIVGAERAELVVALDPDDESKRVLAVHKHNLHKPVPALSWELVEQGEHACVRWLGESHHTAAQLLAVPADESTRTETDEAAAWLRDLLMSRGGEVSASEAREVARRASISDKVLRLARRRLGIKPDKRGFGQEGEWVWQLPPGPSDSPLPDPPRGHLSMDPGEDRPGDDRGTLTSPKMPYDPLMGHEGILGELGHLSEEQPARSDSITRCSVTSNAHVYARLRDHDRRRICIECNTREGESSPHPRLHPPHALGAATARP